MTTQLEHITPQQVRYFETFGFLRLPGLFADDIADITKGFEQVFEENPSWKTEEALHFDDKRMIIPGFVEKSPLLANLPSDPRVTGIIRSLMGNEFEYAESDGNLFYCDTSWHSDTYSAPMSQYHVKISFYLDNLSQESGAIRMIPGTHQHKSRYTIDVRQSVEDPSTIPELLGINPRDVPAYAIASEPGDAIVWSFRTIHASFGGDERRRLFSLNFRQI